METVECKCPLPEKYPDLRSVEVADYLRRLADRVDRQEIHHVSVSVHPVGGG